MLLPVHKDSSQPDKRRKALFAWEIVNSGLFGNKSKQGVGIALKMLIW